MHLRQSSLVLPCILPSTLQPWGTGSGELGISDCYKIQEVRISFSMGQFYVEEGFAMGHQASRLGPVSLTLPIWEMG